MIHLFSTCDIMSIGLNRAYTLKSCVISSDNGWPRDKTRVPIVFIGEVFCFAVREQKSVINILPCNLLSAYRGTQFRNKIAYLSGSSHNAASGAEGPH
ncbi:hypothetical protein DPMN_131741 [Dreissena polymorpha]|uniref:Uncharacterized protein n=1 Tax=Dreissena polymorpha TaxID=45954 RepID=A0A9D4J9F7_DREPO|nr:hypothetical protein DPMN_131741 [Dreissena polymorpha]